MFQTLDARRIIETIDKLQSRIEPQMRKATYKVPHQGVAGTAANFALHLARC